MAKTPVTLTFTKDAISVLKQLAVKYDRSQAYMAEKAIVEMGLREGIEPKPETLAKKSKK